MPSRVRFLEARRDTSASAPEDRVEEWGRTLVVLDNVSEVIAPAVVRLPDAYGVVGEVDIAIVACNRQLGQRSAIKARRRNLQKTRGSPSVQLLYQGIQKEVLTFGHFVARWEVELNTGETCWGIKVAKLHKQSTGQPKTLSPSRIK